MVAIFRIILLNRLTLSLLSYFELDKCQCTACKKIIEDLNHLASKIGLQFSHYQDNKEHVPTNYVHQTQNNTDLIMTNPTVFVCTSVTCITRFWKLTSLLLRLILPRFTYEKRFDIILFFLMLRLI